MAPNRPGTTPPLTRTDTPTPIASITTLNTWLRVAREDVAAVPDCPSRARLLAELAPGRQREQPALRAAFRALMLAYERDDALVARLRALINHLPSVFWR